MCPFLVGDTSHGSALLNLHDEVSKAIVFSLHLTSGNDHTSTVKHVFISF